MQLNYGNKEIEYLKQKDKKLAWAIEKIGYINIDLDSDLFASIVYQIVGQQISMAAQKTVCNKLDQLVGKLNAENIHKIAEHDLQQCGLSFRKVQYIKNFATMVINQEIDLDNLYNLSDQAIIEQLSKIKGIGVWTAQMLMTFSMGRMDVLSFYDLAILRGMRMLYRHRIIDQKIFNKYKKRYSPYATIAALYLWEISNGAIAELKDPKLKKSNQNIKLI